MMSFNMLYTQSNHTENYEDNEEFHLISRNRYINRRGLFSSCHDHQPRLQCFLVHQLCSRIHPLCLALEALNTATCFHMFWVSISNLAFFVNSVFWDRDIVNLALVWRDISSRIIIGTDVAIPATCLCIQRRLHHALLNPVSIPLKEKNNVLLF